VAKKDMFGKLTLASSPDKSWTPKSKVCLIYTGGTIGMVPRDKANPASPLRPATLDELLESIPGLGYQEKIQLGMVSFKDPVDSSDITAKHWIAIAKEVEKQYNDFDGFVVLHGTDTMAYTSSALSFLLNYLAKPVVVTGAQLPIVDPRTDGVLNLTNALHIAGYQATKLPRIPEVVLCFGGVLLRGNRATKTSSSSLQGFSSPNCPPLGVLGEHISIRQDLLVQVPDEGRFKMQADNELADQIGIVFVNPGLTPSHLQRFLKTKGLRGAILVTYGAGNMSTNPDYVEVLKAAVSGGEGYASPVPILNVTQCSEGEVEMGLYEASSGLVEAGVASGLDLTLEAAITKMYWAVARHSGGTLKNQLQTSRCGEQTFDLYDLITVPEASYESAATSVLTTDGQDPPSGFSKDALKRALLRIQGLGMANADEECSVRVFLNAVSPAPETSVDLPSFAFEVHREELEESGNIVRDVTDVFDQAVYPRQPVSIAVVGVNTDVWCKSIHLALYAKPGD